jgi:acetyl-CoA carboxylase biotin carboxylase subunit
LKILIANRGEIVIRVAKTAMKLNLIPCGIYSQADNDSLFIKHCKESVNIGGFTAVDSYLRMDKVINAAKQLGCELVHPGYGFLAENAQFSELCHREGLGFVGPSPDTLKISGDKLKAKRVASKVSPVLQGQEVSQEDDALQAAKSVGYPVILKATRGGGGRGLRIANSQDDLKRVFNSSRNESLISFGSASLFVEKYIENPRHIEVQIIGDKSDVIHLGERECSIQRRHQKLIEETPSPALTNKMRETITQTAIAIMKELGYDNAGTVEFLFKNDRFYFMEVNSRIQVEHPITEEVTGIDIVEQQIRVTSGMGLTVKQRDISPNGHAIECRINAEHPISFVPYPGTVDTFDPPQGIGVRVDSAMYSGYTIPPYYDSLIAKLICHGKTRSDAINMMLQSLMSFKISGIPSTVPFHISALNDQRFRGGKYDTSFIDQLKPYSTEEGEIASAILSLLPKKIKFLNNDVLEDPWLKSRHNFSNESISGLDLFSRHRWS